MAGEDNQLLMFMDPPVRSNLELDESKQRATRYQGIENARNELFVERGLRKGEAFKFRVNRIENDTTFGPHWMTIGLSTCKPNADQTFSTTCNQHCLTFFNTNVPKLFKKEDVENVTCKRRTYDMRMKPDQQVIDPNERPNIIIERFHDGSVSIFKSYEISKQLEIQETWRQYIFDGFYSYEKLYLYIIMDGKCSDLTLIPDLRDFELIEEALQQHVLDCIPIENDPPAPSAPPPDDLHRPYECCICQDKIVNAVFLECGHASTCRDCAIMVVNSSYRCPICRESISRYKTIYLDHPEKKLFA